MRKNAEVVLYVQTKFSNVGGEVAHGCVLIVQAISLLGILQKNMTRSVTNDTLLLIITLHESRGEIIYITKEDDRM